MVAYSFVKKMTDKNVTKKKDNDIKSNHAY